MKHEYHYIGELSVPEPSTAARMEVRFPLSKYHDRVSRKTSTNKPIMVFDYFLSIVSLFATVKKLGRNFSS